MSEIKQDEYERQLPFEYSVNKILDVIDIKLSTNMPILSVVEALYNKVSFILDNKEIEIKYKKINENKGRAFEFIFKEYYINHSKNISIHERSDDWVCWSNGHIDRKANEVATIILNNECKELVRLIVKDLKTKHLILLSKKELESSHE